MSTPMYCKNFVANNIIKLSWKSIKLLDINPFFKKKCYLIGKLLFGIMGDTFQNLWKISFVPCLLVRSCPDKMCGLSKPSPALGWARWQSWGQGTELGVGSRAARLGLSCRRPAQWPLWMFWNGCESHSRKRYHGTGQRTALASQERPVCSCRHVGKSWVRSMPSKTWLRP